MSFSNAYYIPKSEKKVYANGREEMRMPSDFKKYQLLRIAALFGYNVSVVNNTLMLSNGKSAIHLTGRPLTDEQFVLHMRTLRNLGYNDLRRYALTGADKSKVKSQSYDSIKIWQSEHDFGKQLDPNVAYPESTDPLFYVQSLLEDLKRNNKTAKYNALKQQIVTGLEDVAAAVDTTEWGSKPISYDQKHSMADSLKKFVETAKFELRDQQAEMGA